MSAIYHKENRNYFLLKYEEIKIFNKCIKPSNLREAYVFHILYILNIF